MLTGKKLIRHTKKEALLLCAVAHPYRLAIINLLNQTDMRLKEMAVHMQVKENLVAHHVKKLSAAGIIENYQVGARRFYRLNKKSPLFSRYLRFEHN